MNLAGTAGAYSFGQQLWADCKLFELMRTMKMLVQLSGLSALMASALGQWDFELHL
jgi:hypothetical protein